jgi:hypothetical protein
MVEIQPDLCLERLSIEWLKTPSSDQGFERDPSRTEDELLGDAQIAPGYDHLAAATAFSAATPCSVRPFSSSGRESEKPLARGTRKSHYAEALALIRQHRWTSGETQRSEDEERRRGCRKRVERGGASREDTVRRWATTEILGSGRSSTG